MPRKKTKLTKRNSPELKTFPKETASARCVNWILALPSQETLNSHNTTEIKAKKNRNKRGKASEKSVVSVHKKKWPEASARKAKKGDLKKLCKRESRRQKRREKRQASKTSPKKVGQQCRKCLAEQWPSKLKRTLYNRRSKFIYGRKYRTRHFLSMKRGKPSLGWAVIQAVKVLERKKQAYPLKILMLLQKWGFHELNIIKVNDALKWMTKKNILSSKINNDIASRWLHQRKPWKNYGGYHQKNVGDETSRRFFQCQIPHTTSIKTAWKHRKRACGFKL